LFSLVQQFPSQLSFESLETSNSGNSKSTIVTNDSLPSSPSLASLDKISMISNNSAVFVRHHLQPQQCKSEQVKKLEILFFNNNKYFI
jgi:hypothetical protein